MGKIEGVEASSPGRAAVLTGPGEIRRLIAPSEIFSGNLARFEQLASVYGESFGIATELQW
jgi:hypothetical protein